MERRSRWALGWRELAYAVVGTVLYGAAIWLTDFLRLPSALNVNIKPAVLVPIFGFVYGPVVGLVVGFAGNALGDVFTASGFVWNWHLGSGLVGLVSGLAGLRMHHYASRRDLLLATGWAVLGIAVGMGFASCSDFLMGEADQYAAWYNLFLPTFLSDSVNAIVLVPILLYNYGQPGAGGAGQSILITTLLSSLVPLAFLGFLTVQGYSQAASGARGHLGGPAAAVPADQKVRIKNIRE